MKSVTRIGSVPFALALAFGLTGAASLWGQEAATASATVVPPLIRFNGTMVTPETQGRASGADSSRLVAAAFSLYELQEGGSPLWSESQNVELDEQGHYAVLLGANSADGLPLDLFTSGKALWMGMRPQVPGAEELPRVLLVAVPYALKASDSDTLGGRPASAYALAGSPEAAEGADRRATANSTASSSPATLLPLTDSGPTVFTGTTAAPAALVEIEQKGTGDALLLQSLRATSATDYLIHAQAGATPKDVFKVDTRGDVTAALGDYLGTTTAANSGVLTVVQKGSSSTGPTSTTTPPAAIFGDASATTGYASGVVGISAVPNEGAGGVVGVNTTPSAKSDGVLGLALSTEGTGVNGIALASTGGARGVVGEVHSPGGIAGEFINTAGGEVLYTATGSSGQTPVFTVSTSSGGYFFGNLKVGGSLNVTGSLNVGGAKHAVQQLPDGRSVALNALETPESWFEDFGSAMLQHGAATIQLDPTFAQTVNTGIEYHVFLTPSGNCRGLYVAEKTPNGFEVREAKNGKSNIAFDYRVVARRRGFEKERLEEIAPVPDSF